MSLKCAPTARRVPATIAAGLLGFVGHGVSFAGDDCGPLFVDQSYHTDVSFPSGIVFGDVDGDALPDMVVADADLGVGVHLGLGDGSFGPRTDYLMGPNIPDQGGGITSLRLGDLNGDGWLDVVICGYLFDEQQKKLGTNERGGNPNYIHNRVTYRLNNGDGTFGAFSSFSTAADPQDLVLADLDGDNDLDIAITEFDAFLGVSYWLNNGSASFTFGNGLPTSIGGTAIDAGDVDGDGDQDLLVARTFNHVLDVLINLGGGSFAAPVSYALSGLRPGGLDVGDVDGDGDLDAVVTVDSGARLDLFRNTGAGAFAPVVSVSTGSDPLDVKLADFDDDGDLDALVACAGTRTIRTHLNNGSGVFAAGQFFSTGGVVKIDVADVNDDGLVDLGMANSLFSSGYAVRLNTPTGLASARTDYAPVSDPNKLSLFDMDNDGDLDIAVGRISSLSPNLAVMVNAGDGTYPTTVNLFTETNPYPATGDVNADGFADIVTANLSGSSMSVFLSNGAGGFAAPVKTELGGLVRASVLGDLDGDSDLDFVTNIASSGLVVMMLNNGAGAFTTRVDLAVGSNPDSVALSDVDADGDLDLVVTRRLADVVTVYMNNGSGAFAPGVDYPTDGDPFFVGIADLDGDNDPDMVTCNFRFDSVDGHSSLTFYYNNGSGVFGGRIDQATGFGAEHVAFGDFDADGDTDMSVTNSDSYGYQIWLNDLGPGTSWTVRSHHEGRRTRWTETADLNGDGRTDLITAQASGFVTVHTNAGCAEQPCIPDLAAPPGVLNFFDIQAFIGLFNAQSATADLAAPLGVWNFFDIQQYIALFNAGCP